MMKPSELVPLAKGIAAQLGGVVESPSGGSQEKEITYVNIVLEDGTTFYVSLADSIWPDGARWEEREFSTVHVSDQWPRHVIAGNRNAHTEHRDFLPYAEWSTAPKSIRMTVTKTPAQMAKDIERRFLKSYRPLYARAVAWCEKQANYYAQKVDAEAIADREFAGIPGVQVTTVLPDRVTITVTTCIGKAAALAKAMKGLDLQLRESKG